MPRVSDAMLHEYAKHRDRLHELAREVHARVEALLLEASVPVSFISWRLKDPTSLAHKLARPDRVVPARVTA